MSPWVWFSAAVLLSAAELVGGEFVLLMLGGGALAATVVALALPGLLWLQLIVFALASVGLVFGARPALLRHFHGPSAIRTGIDALIGRTAVVVSTVDPDGGQVKIGGEVWSARGLDFDRQLPPGTPVTVVEVQGATAVVISGP